MNAAERRAIIDWCLELTTARRAGLVRTIAPGVRPGLALPVWSAEHAAYGAEWTCGRIDASDIARALEVRG